MFLLGLKATDIANALPSRGRSSKPHIDPNTVRRWAADEVDGEARTSPDYDDIVALAEFLGITPQDLLEPPPMPAYPLDERFLLRREQIAAAKEAAQRLDRKGRGRRDR